MAVFKFNYKPKDVPKVNTSYRKIVTKIPAPQSLKFFEENQKYEPASLHQQIPLIWDRAIDFQIFDPYGNCWLDQTSTIFVTNTGHANPQVAQAIKEQIDRQLMHNYCYPSEIRIKLAKKLLSVSPKQMEKVLFLSTGAEATECALKITRIHGQKINKDKKIIISFTGAFHGKTMGSQMVSGKPDGAAWIGYSDPYIYHMQFPFSWLLAEKKISGAKYFKNELKRFESKGFKPQDIAGFFVETYQGWNAAFLPKDFMQALRFWADQNQALVVFDEIQAGFGRTGKWFGFEHYEVKADIICCGKGLSGSLPLSAVISTAKILDADSSLTSTHSGNPLSVAAGIANLDYMIDKKLVEQAAEKGKYFYELLNNLKKKYTHKISYILGAGLVWGLFITKDNSSELDLDIDFTNKIVERAFQKGVLLIQTNCGTLKFGPPLTTPPEALKEAIEVIDECFEELLNEKR